MKHEWRKSKRVAEQYGRLLRKIAENVGKIVETSGVAEDWNLLPDLDNLLKSYARIIEPWARATAKAMLDNVDKQDRATFNKNAQEISAGIKREIRETPTGSIMQNLLAERVQLITSIPFDASERVHKLITEAKYKGLRSETIAEEIMRTGKVMKSRATLIARTEVASAASIFTEARAKQAGSTGYIWRTVKDSDVRSSHKKMEGVFVPWDNPPLVDGQHFHAGRIYNCRCYPEPVF